MAWTRRSLLLMIGFAAILAVGSSSDLRQLSSPTGLRELSTFEAPSGLATPTAGEEGDVVMGVASQVPPSPQPRRTERPLPQLRLAPYPSALPALPNRQPPVATGAHPTGSAESRPTLAMPESTEHEMGSSSAKTQRASDPQLESLRVPTAGNSRATPASGSAQETAGPAELAPSAVSPAHTLPADAGPNPPRVFPPRVLSTAGTDYPGEAFHLVVRRQDLGSGLQVVGAEGTVSLRALVRSDGVVRDVEVLSSSGSAVLDGTAVGTVLHWHFAPATRDGVPIDAYVTLKIRYVVR
jgi:periplasmic protein TonB